MRYITTILFVFISVLMLKTEIAYAQSCPPGYQTYSQIFQFNSRCKFDVTICYKCSGFGTHDESHFIVQSIEELNPEACVQNDEWLHGWLMEQIAEKVQDL